MYFLFFKRIRNPSQFCINYLNPDDINVRSFSLLRPQIMSSEMDFDAIEVGEGHQRNESLTTSASLLEKKYGVQTELIYIILLIGHTIDVMNTYCLNNIFCYRIRQFIYYFPFISVLTEEEGYTFNQSCQAREGR